MCNFFFSLKLDKYYKHNLSLYVFADGAKSATIIYLLKNDTFAVIYT